MTVVDAVALGEHVFGLSGFGVVGSVLVNVGADIGEKVGAVAGLGDCVADAHKVALVFGKLLAEEGEVVLLQSGGGEGRFGVEEAG